MYPNESCETCRYSYQGDLEDPESRSCMRFPPHKGGFFPSMHIKEWCGEWASKEQKKKKKKLDDKEGFYSYVTRCKHCNQETVYRVEIEDKEDSYYERWRSFYEVVKGQYLRDYLGYCEFCDTFTVNYLVAMSPY